MILSLEDTRIFLTHRWVCDLYEKYWIDEGWDGDGFYLAMPNPEGGYQGGGELYMELLWGEVSL